MNESIPKAKIKILILEDDREDAEIMIELLNNQGFHFEYCLVAYKQEFLVALDEFMPDLILSDNDLPQFSALEALELLKVAKYPVPFILVTGTVSEAFALKVIKAGANDYILKDRLTRLPAAMHAALENGKTKKDLADYKFALDQSAIISITDPEGIMTYVNANFCSISKYSEDELLGQSHRIINSGYHTKEYFEQMWHTIIVGQIWRGEFCNKAKDGSIYWVDATVVPFLDSKGRPFQYLAIRNDITQKKALEEEVIKQKLKEQKKITRAVIKAAEKERNFLGEELHDNINQILIGAKLHLAVIAGHDEQTKSLLKYPLELLDLSIKEIRELSHRMVSPAMEINIEKHVRRLLPMINHPGLTSNFICTVDDMMLTPDLQLNIYRVLQEILTNILKYAAASVVDIVIKTENSNLFVAVADNGKGFDVSEHKKGIGLFNIKNRIESFNGKLLITSSPGKGTSIHISIPLDEGLLAMDN